MSKLTVHVLKPSHLISGHAEDAMFIAQQTHGPLTYKLVDVDYEPPGMDDIHVGVSKNVASGDVDEHGRSLEDMNDRGAMETPDATESGLEWIGRLQNIERQYRANHDVPDTDFVIVLSTKGNLENYFVIPRFDGHRMAGIQLNHFVTQEVKSHILVGYYLMAIPVMLVALFQFGLTGDFYWVVGLYMLIQVLDGNVLVPLLFSEAVDLHPVAIIIAVLVFGGLWGVWGVFFAIPLATLCNVLLVSWRRVATE